MENMCCCVQARCLLQLTAARTAADGKTFKKPRRPFEKERLDSELKLVGEFGLRNKRELWRVQMALSKIRQVCGLAVGGGHRTGRGSRRPAAPPAASPRVPALGALMLAAQSGSSFAGKRYSARATLRVQWRQHSSSGLIRTS